MPLEIGPYDGRKARRKRCDACVKRKIKCHGGIPCENCKRTSRSCKTPIKSTRYTPVFINESPNMDKRFNTFESPHIRAAITLPQRIHPNRADHTIPYFFTSFLPMNILTSNKAPINNELLAMAKISPALEDAINAVAALHRKHQDQLRGETGGGNCETSEALQAYSRSVRSVQSKIASDAFLRDPSSLWTTFLLGLFELMRDSTGTNWLSHFLHGTCTMLRLQRTEILVCPGAHNSQKRMFFLTARIFEIARSLIYSEATFLSEPDWIVALASFWRGEGAPLWHPKEALFDILPSISDLSIRAMHFCQCAAQLSARRRHVLSQLLAEEGLILQTSLQNWWVETTMWERATRDPGNCYTTSSKLDNELLVGYTYYHAISIYLSGTYDYHVHWSRPNAPKAPILPRSKIDWHVFEILRLSQELLDRGTAGVLLFFPLRVAGARAVDMLSRNYILNLLHATKRRGFIVAEAFVLDLSHLWTRRSII